MEVLVVFLLSNKCIVMTHLARFTSPMKHPQGPAAWLASHWFKTEACEKANIILLDSVLTLSTRHKPSSSPSAILPFKADGNTC